MVRVNFKLYFNFCNLFLILVVFNLVFVSFLLVLLSFIWILFILNIFFFNGLLVVNKVIKVKVERILFVNIVINMVVLCGLRLNIFSFVLFIFVFILLLIVVIILFKSKIVKIRMIFVVINVYW